MQLYLLMFYLFFLNLILIFFFTFCIFFFYSSSHFFLEANGKSFLTGENEVRFYPENYEQARENEILSDSVVFVKKVEALGPCPKDFSVIPYFTTFNGRQIVNIEVHNTDIIIEIFIFIIIIFVILSLLLLLIFFRLKWVHTFMAVARYRPVFVSTIKPS